MGVICIYREGDDPYDSDAEKARIVKILASGPLGTTAMLARYPKTAKMTRFRSLLSKIFQPRRAV